MPPKEDPVIGACSRVWTHLDNEKYDMAEKALEPLMEKYSQHLAVRITLMLMLHQTGQSDLARDVAKRFITTPEDLDVIAKTREYMQMVSFVLTAHGAMEEVATLYKKTIPNFPQEENLLENNVTCLVCCKNFKDAQVSAMQLFKKTAKPLHQTWAIMANLFATPLDAPPTTLQLVIATRMLEQQMGNKTIGYQGAGMYVDALKRQEHYDKALDFIVSEDGSLLGMESTRLEQCSELYKLKKQASNVAAVSLFLWRNLEPDNWTYFASLLAAVEENEDEAENLAGDAGSLDLVLATRSKDGENKKEGDKEEGEKKGGDKFVVNAPVLRTLQELVEVAEELVAKELDSTTTKKLRGPFMAALELASKLAEKADNKAEAAAKLQSNLERFLKQFSTKPTCFWDTAKFAAALRQLGVTSQWWDALLPKADDVNPKSELADHLKLILRYQYESLDLQQQAGSGGDGETTSANCASLVERCLAGLEQSKALSKKLVWSEEGLTDGYALVALNATLHGYQLAKDPSWLWLGLHVLQFTPRKKNNPILLQYSLHYHRLLGALDSASWVQLDIKSIQYDSMALLDLHVLLGSGPLVYERVWERLWDSELHYIRSAKEIREVRGKIFKHVAPTKQKEVELFDGNMTNSIARLESHVYSIFYRLSKCDTKKDRSLHLHSTRSHLLRSVLEIPEDEIQCHHDSKIVQSITLFAAGSKEGDLNAAALEELILPRPTLQSRIVRVKFLAKVFAVYNDVAFRGQLDDEVKKKTGGGGKAAKKAAAAAGGDGPSPLAEAQASFDRLRMSSLDKTKEEVAGWNGEELLPDLGAEASGAILKVFEIIVPLLAGHADTPLGKKPEVFKEQAVALAAACESLEHSGDSLPFVGLIICGMSLLGGPQVKAAALSLEKTLNRYLKETAEQQTAWAKWNPLLKPIWIEGSKPLLDCIPILDDNIKKKALQEFGAKIDVQTASVAKELKRLIVEARVASK